MRRSSECSRRFVLGSMGALPLVLQGCGPATSVPAGGPGSPASSGGAGTSGARTPAGQLVIGSLEEPASLSALVALPHHFPEHVPQTLLFESLTQFMPDGSVAPKLAESWTVSPDNLVNTFTLAPGARFHDGHPVTAEDVKFTFDAAVDPATKSSDEGLTNVAQTEAVDLRTVRVTLKGLNPKFLAEGGGRGIVPKHLLEGKDLSRDEFNKRPIGSGPFKLAGYTPGQSIVMEAVPDFYRGAPAIGRVVFKILTDQNVILTQLRSGKLQYALVTPRDLAAVQGIRSLKVVEARTPRFFDIVPNYQRPYWQDQRVREAALVAIDRQGIVDKVLLGHGEVLEANVSPVSWAYNPNVPKHPHDPARARALLDEAGWRPGGDGVRQKAGQRLAFGVMLNNYDRTLDQALVVAQQNLKDVGVVMRLERVEAGVFSARRTRKEFDALSRVWNPVYDPDQGGLAVSGNFYGYSNPRVDELSKQAFGTVDREVRKRAYFEVQEHLAGDVARLFLYTENELHAVAANVTGMQPHPVNFFWNVKDWKLGA